jgi:EmrB/QacA subfamily drug resistance transporter
VTSLPAAPDQSQVRYAWRVMTVTTIGALLVGVNTSTMDVALPSVSRHFDATPTQASWILLSYLLVNTSLILVFGRITDLIGRRRLYLIGLLTFTGASFLCGWAPDPAWLIAFRVLQAVGGAALLCNITALLTDAFPGRLLATALGLNVTLAALGQVVGPVLGGALVDSFGWRSVFWFNVPLGLFGIGWARLTLRSDRRPDRTEPFDAVGAVLSVVAVSGLVLALSEGNSMGWTSPLVLISFAAFALAAPSFVVVERRRPYPMLDLAVFLDRERGLAYLALFLMALARFAVVLMISLYLQAASGASALDAGTQVLFVALGMAIVSPVAGRLAGRHSARILSSAGAALIALPLFVLAVEIGPDINRIELAGLLSLIGVGTGLFMTPNTSSIMISVVPARRGVANGARQAVQQAGYVISTALALLMITINLSETDKRSAYAGTLAQLSPHALHEFTSGYRIAFVVLATICVVAVFASLSRNPRPVGSAEPEAVEAP